MSSLLSREALPDVKDVFVIVSREESYRGIASSSSGSVSKPHVMILWLNLIIRLIMRIKGVITRNLEIMSILVITKVIILTYFEQTVERLSILLTGQYSSDLADDVYMTLSSGFDNQKSKVSKESIVLSFYMNMVNLLLNMFDTPLLENTTLKHIESDDDHLLDTIENYQKLVGKLIYNTNIRLDISYAVHCLSQFVHASLVSHSDVVLRVLTYLKGSTGSGIQFNKNCYLNLRAYAATHRARCPTARKSISGYCVFLGDSLVTWKNQKQYTLSREKVKSGVVKTEKIHTRQQIADVLTKALDIEQYTVLCEKLSCIDSSFFVIYLLSFIVND
nr:ribonuclease H-like domain-containing protein [Tanacetum cinerariifolium]